VVKTCPSTRVKTMAFRSGVLALCFSLSTAFTVNTESFSGEGDCTGPSGGNQTWSSGICIKAHLLLPFDFIMDSCDGNGVKTKVFTSLDGSCTGTPTSGSIGLPPACNEGDYHPYLATCVQGSTDASLSGNASVSSPIFTVNAQVFNSGSCPSGSSTPQTLQIGTCIPTGVFSDMDFKIDSCDGAQVATSTFSSVDGTCSSSMGTSSIPTGQCHTGYSTPYILTCVQGSTEVGHAIVV
jgi:hypothetical protein